jgi:hypothetical protein
MDTQTTHSDGFGKLPAVASLKEPAMSKPFWIVSLAVLAAATSAMAQDKIPDLRGTWKGESETIILGPGNPHHAVPSETGSRSSRSARSSRTAREASVVASDEPRLNSVPFTLTIDKQDGRRFSGTFSSARANDKIIAVISRNGTIYAVDDDGFTSATILAPDRMEFCYMMLSRSTQIASCTELTKQP